MTISSGSVPRIILASSSPRRREILHQIGIQFLVDPSTVDEPPPESKESAQEYALRLARLKALSISKKHEQALVVGADTVVLVGRKILGKPSGEEEAGAMLRRLSGRWHQVSTGLFIIDCRNRRTCSGTTTTRVHFRRLSRMEIDRYVRTGEFRDKAGAYAIQGLAGLFIDRIEGCYFNVVGFPVADFGKLCRRLGVDLTDRIALNPI